MKVSRIAKNRLLHSVDIKSIVNKFKSGFENKCICKQWTNWIKILKDYQDIELNIS